MWLGMVCGCGASDGSEPVLATATLSSALSAAAALSAADAAAAAEAAPAAEAPSAPDAGSEALQVTLIAPPRPVTTSEGRRHLVYELLLLNLSEDAQRITALEVFEPGRRLPLASFAGDTLQRIIVTGDPATGSIEPGSAAIAFLDLTFERSERLPERLEQRLHTDTGAVVTEAVPVLRERPIRLRAPLRGGNLADLNGCCRSEHGRALLANDAGFFVAQRYAPRRRENRLPLELDVVAFPNH